MKTRTTLLCTSCGEGPHAVKPLYLSHEEEVISTNQNIFALDLLKQVNLTEQVSENVFLSPLSVAIVSSMLANGTDGETLSQILLTIGAGDYSVDYLNDFDMDKLNELESLMGSFDVQVQMPKFKLDYRRDLEKDMQALGMTDVFDNGRADLTDLATYNGLGTDANLFLDKLFQKTYLEVDEEGAKAAAVTIGLVANKAAPSMPIEPFIVDRPFLLFIREVKYGTVLFAGKIGKP